MSNDIIPGQCINCTQALFDGKTYCTDSIKCRDFKQAKNKYKDYCVRCHGIAVFFPEVIDKHFYCASCAQIIKNTYNTKQTIDQLKKVESNWKNNFNYVVSQLSQYFK